MIVKICGCNFCGGENIMDNVFASIVEKDSVTIKAGCCKNTETERITDSDVDNIKEFKMLSSDFAVFFRVVVTAAMKLQDEYDVDLGLKLEEKN